MTAIAELEDDFLEGKLDTLFARKCPQCGQEGILYSVAKQLRDLTERAGRRYTTGISIYCRAECNTMLTHLDGYCPAWAEDVEDWQQFSDVLLSPGAG